MDSYHHLFELINPLLEITHQASEEILKIYNDQLFDVKIKSDDSPVTSADLASNDIICAGLKLLSDYPIISEEELEIPYSVRSKYEYFWLIDPLDGTKEFVKRNGQFAINIALIHHGKAVLGIVAVPFYHEVYYAIKGLGSFLEKNNQVCRLECGQFDEHKKNMIVPISMSYVNKETIEYIEKYNEPIKVSKGSALKFMMIANAQADVYPRLAPTMEWDTAAPQIIVEEAGGSLINIETNEPMGYNKLSLINPGFVTYSKRLV
jgi:3'(2'), 5'-bisphosphate nucleotidase